MIRRIWCALAGTLLLAAPAFAFQAAAGQGPDTQDQWVPVTGLPPSQQLPAGPYRVAAYAFIWVGLMVYLWSIWRRLGRVEKEMHALDDRLRRSASR